MCGNNGANVLKGAKSFIHDDDFGKIYVGMVNKQFVASTTRNKMPPKRRLGVG